MVSVDAAIASIISELESISPLKEEQHSKEKVFTLSYVISMFIDLFG